MYISNPKRKRDHLETRAPPRLGTCQVYERPTKLASSIMKKDKFQHARHTPPPFNSRYNQNGHVWSLKEKAKKTHFLPISYTPFTSSTPNLQNRNVDVCVLKSRINVMRRFPIRSNGRNGSKCPTIEPHTIILQSGYVHKLMNHVTTKMPPSPTYSCESP